MVYYMSLSQKHCKPCEGGTSPFSTEENQKFIKEVDNWTIEGEIKLEKILVFKNFKEALDFVNKVGAIAEAENHHPNISIFDYKKVQIELYTHAIGGLSKNDFILASKIDALSRKDQF